MFTVKALPPLSSLIMGWVVTAIIVLLFIAIPIFSFVGLKRKINNIENSLNEIKEKLYKNL